MIDLVWSGDRRHDVLGQRPAQARCVGLIFLLKLKKVQNFVCQRGDAVQAKIKNYYSNFTKPAGSLDPPFTHSNGVKFDEFGHPDFKNHCPGKEFTLNSNELDGGQFKIDGTQYGQYELRADCAKANSELLKNYEIDVLHPSGSPIKIKINGKMEGPFTWHHHEDGKTLMPVLQSIHEPASTVHSGGASVIKNQIKGVFKSPH